MQIDLKAFRQTLTYAGTGSIREICQRLHEIEAIDKLDTAKQKQTYTLAGYYFPVAFVSLPLAGGFAHFGLITHAWLVMIVFAGAAIVGTVLLIKSARYGRLNLVNYRYKLAQKLLTAIRRDAQPQASINLQLDFNPSLQKKKIVATIPHPRKPGWKLRHYRDMWLQVSGKFLDKTEFSLTIAELNCIASGFKQGRSGKSKPKSKTKFKGTILRLELNYPQRKYGDLQQLPAEISSAIQLPETATVKRWRATNETLELDVKTSVNPKDSLDTVYQIAIAMFLSLYQILNYAKITQQRAKELNS